MSKRRVLLILCAVLLTLHLSSSLADEVPRTVVWRVTAPALDGNVLQNLTFHGEGQGASSGKAPYISPFGREDRHGVMYWRQEADQTIFCAYDYAKAPKGMENAQIHFEIVRHQDSGAERIYAYNYDMWNAVPEQSGFSASGAMDTVEAATGLLQELSLLNVNTGVMPVSFSTMGRMEGTTPCRKVIISETLEGLPIRLSAELLSDSVPVSAAGRIEPCYVQAVFSDEDGLINLEGSWCAFAPLENASRILSAEEALTRFASVGLATSETTPEICWFLASSAQDVTATLAWRVGNSYLSAVDGTWLQTEN